MKKMKDCRGDIMRPVSTNGVDIQHLADAIIQGTEANGIPANVSVDEITTGGLFGNVMPCIVVSHPNPPISYFEHLLIFNGDIINFKFYGFSKATYNNNMKEADRNSGKLSGLLKASLRSDMSMELQTEQLWHSDLCSLYAAILKLND